MNNKMDAYFLLIVISVGIGAIALIYYNPFKEIIAPMDIPELTITQMEFTTLSDSEIIIVHATNTGTLPVTVDAVKINGETQNKITVDSIHGLTFEPGDSRTFTLEHDWITGNSYTVSLFNSGGWESFYTDTA
jgi:hypothetical protein